MKREEVERKRAREEEGVGGGERDAGRPREMASEEGDGGGGRTEVREGGGRNEEREKVGRERAGREKERVGREGEREGENVERDREGGGGVVGGREGTRTRKPY